MVLRRAQTIANGALWSGHVVVDARPALSGRPCHGLALETACFVASAALVGRPRPDGVWRPEPPHATSSFPSGHTAAAFALHGTFADLLDRHGARSARLLGPVLRYGIPGAIAFSRVYRGQHHISDTVAGAILGRWSAAVVRQELISSYAGGPPARRPRRSGRSPVDRSIWSARKGAESRRGEGSRHGRPQRIHLRASSDERMIRPHSR